MSKMVTLAVSTAERTVRVVIGSAGRTLTPDQADQLAGELIEAAGQARRLACDEAYAASTVEDERHDYEPSDVFAPMHTDPRCAVCGAARTTGNHT